MKGTQDFLGYITTGRNMHAVLNTELPKLVYLSSVQLIEPQMELPICSFPFAFQNKEFMLFYEQFDFDIDSRKYRDGWLSNDIHHLSTEITDECIQCMEAALEGHLGVSVGERQRIRDITSRFHFCVWKKHPTNPNETYVSCDCYRYYYEKWCYNAATFQHKNQLQLDGKRFPSGPKKSLKVNRKVLDQQALQHAALRKKKQLNNEILRGPPSTIIQEKESPNILTQEDTNDQYF
jgi:hypothetical protein